MKVEPFGKGRVVINKERLCDKIKIFEICLEMSINIIVINKQLK